MNLTNKLLSDNRSPSSFALARIRSLYGTGMFRFRERALYKNRTDNKSDTHNFRVTIIFGKNHVNRSIV